MRCACRRRRQRRRRALERRCSTSEWYVCLTLWPQTLHNRVAIALLHCVPVEHEKSGARCCRASCCWLKCIFSSPYARSANTDNGRQCNAIDRFAASPPDLMPDDIQTVFLANSTSPHVPIASSQRHVLYLSAATDVHCCWS